MCVIVFLPKGKPNVCCKDITRMIAPNAREARNLDHKLFNQVRPK